MTNEEKWLIVSLLQELEHDITMGKSRSYLVGVEATKYDNIHRAYEALGYNVLTNSMEAVKS